MIRNIFKSKKLYNINCNLFIVTTTNIIKHKKSFLSIKSFNFGVFNNRLEENIDLKNLYDNTKFKFDESNDINYNIYAFVHKIRKKGKAYFVILRSESITCQAVYFNNSENSKSNNITNSLDLLTNESYINLKAKLVKVNKPISYASIKNYELDITEIKIVSLCKSVLPFQMEDACRFSDIIKENDELNNKNNKKFNKTHTKVNLDTRLDNRVLDLRVPSNFSLIKLRSKIISYFRDFLIDRDFIEINTPKISSTASEGGTAVFNLDFFGNKAYLSQSPQLYKQMSIIAGFNKVFEIGPVFRAENSNTGRHLCEFSMLDIELDLKESNLTYYNSDYNKYISTNFNYLNNNLEDANLNRNKAKVFYLIYLVNELLVYILNNVKDNCSQLLDTINNHYSFNYPIYQKNTKYNSNIPLILGYKEAVELINNYIKNNSIQTDIQLISEDLTTINEKILGNIVKEKYNLDLFFVYGYPLDKRPFYTKSSNYILENNVLSSDSFDCFLRGEEILSGSRRINNLSELIKSLDKHQIRKSSLEYYLEAFNLGVPEHGGVGIGLERLVKLIVNYSNVKKCSMFPRDPRRIIP